MHIPRTAGNLHTACMIYEGMRGVKGEQIM